MKVPKKIRVGALVYDVYENHTVMNEQCRRESTDLLGFTNHQEATIFIEPKQADCQKRDTLLHEILHAVYDTTGLGLECGEEREEREVRRLAPVILSILRDNPKLIAYLTADG